MRSAASGRTVSTRTSGSAATSWTTTRSGIPGTQFYKTVTDDLGPAIKTLFKDGEKGAMDGYNFFGKLGDSFVQVLRMLHNGNLSTYLSWIVIGLGVLSFILIFKL